MRATLRLWHKTKPFPYTSAKKHKKVPGTTVTLVRYQPHTSACEQTGGRPKEKQQ
jgi:hypothetical protein